MYPDIDYLHIGEIGDATDALIATLDEDLSRPQTQRRFETQERLPLEQFPIPAYDAVALGRYLIGSIQFSSGCPYRCEFCDIPGTLWPPAAAQRTQSNCSPSSTP